MRGEVQAHADLMDRVYRRQRYLYDFTRKYYLFGRDSLIRDLAAGPADHIVEIGCGTGRNLVKMARLYPGTHFYGLDASALMLETAGNAVARAGLSSRIHLAQGLAENLAPAMFGRTEPFTHAIFSYSLSMIPDWKQSLKRAAAAVGEGSIRIVDFGDLEGLGEPGAHILRFWLGLFHVTPRVEILRKLKSRRDLAEQGAQLCILPAHYAFIWQGRGRTVQKLAL
jgi:S-adenosylmethionine-diacylgycerolhomoserine-N-methlytransferase